MRVGIVTPNNSGNATPGKSSSHGSSGIETEANSKLLLKSMFPKGMDEVLNKTSPPKPLVNSNNSTPSTVYSSQVRNPVTKSAASLTRSKAFRAGVEKAMRVSIEQFK